MHLVRQSLSFASYNQQRKAAADLRPIYTAATAKQMQLELETFADKWDHSLPTISQARGQRARARSGEATQDPRTQAISSRNALRHGLNSDQLLVLQNKNPEVWNALLEETIQQFQLETPLTHRIIREIAFTKWRLQRGWQVEQ